MGGGANNNSSTMCELNIFLLFTTSRSKGFENIKGALLALRDYITSVGIVVAVVVVVVVVRRLVSQHVCAEEAIVGYFCLHANASVDLLAEVCI